MADKTQFEQAALAAKHGRVAELETIVAAYPAVLQQCDDAGYTLLSLACKAGTGDSALPPVAGTAEQHEGIDLLLHAGADPSRAASNGWAPLHTAAMAGHVDLARRLLAAGAVREGRLLGAEGGSPLSLALFYAQTEVAAVLAPPAVPDNLRSAAALNQSLERFVDGTALTKQASEGTDFYRPLLVFPEWQRTNGRQELLDEALAWAARNDACDAMAALVALGADVNSNAYRGTPLLWAIYSDRVAAATWLLDHGADPNLRHDFGGSSHGFAAVAMHLAAQFSCLGCLKLLLQRGADHSIKDAAYHAIPLGWAEHAQATAAIAVLRDYPV